jgi:hypothetical protein
MQDSVGYILCREEDETIHHLPLSSSGETRAAMHRRHACGRGVANIEVVLTTVEP